MDIFFAELLKKHYNLMNKAIFLDRDGTLNKDGGYLFKPESLELIPGVVEALKIFKEQGFLLIVITNQSGIGRGYYTVEQAEEFNNALNLQLKRDNVEITHFYICPHAPNENCECRKPSPYLIKQAIEKYNINPDESYMFGDKTSDIESGIGAGVTSFLITPTHSLLYWVKKIFDR